MRLYKVLLVMFFFVFLFGCISKPEIKSHVPEQISSSLAFDFDQDNYSDYKEIIYFPDALTDDGSYVLQRVILVSEYENELKIKELYNLSDKEINLLHTLIYEYDNDFKSKECAALGLGQLSSNFCSSPQACYSLCSKCSDLTSDSETIGYWLYNYSKTRKQLEESLEDVEKNIILIKSMSPSAKKVLMRKLNHIIDLSMQINLNPLFSKNVYNICPQFQFKNSNILKMLSILGKYERVPKKYHYSIYITLASNKDTYTSVRLLDKIPSPLSLSILDFVDTGSVKYNLDNASVESNILSFGVNNQLSMLYSFISSLDAREDITWSSPEVDLGQFLVSQNVLFKLIIDFSEYIYSKIYFLGYFAAMAIVALVWIALISIIIFIFRLFFALLNLFLYDKHDALNKFIGYKHINYTTYIVMCILVVGAGFLLTNVFNKPYIEPNLVVDATYIGFKVSNNLMPLFGFVLIFIGGYMIYILLEDLLKKLLSIIFKKRRNEKLALSLLLSKLDDETKILSQLLDKYEQLFSVVDERQLLKANPKDMMEMFIKSGRRDKAIEVGTIYLEKLQKTIQDLNEKADIVKNFWKDYEKQIYLNIKDKSEFPIDSLIFIPSKWRMWVVKRFIAKHPEMSLVIEGKYVKKKVIGSKEKEELLYSRLEGEKLGKYVVIENNKIVKTNDNSKPYLKSILAHRILSYSDVLSKSNNIGKPRYLVLKGDDTSLIIINKVSKIIMISFKTKLFNEILFTLRNTIGLK